MENLKIIIGSILLFIINGYTLILIIRVLTSWVYLPASQFTYWLNRITDPVLNYVRKKFPLRIGFFDLSILVVFLILFIIGKIVDDLLIKSVNLSIFYLFTLIIIIIDSILSLIFTILFIFTLILIITLLYFRNTYNPVITYIKSVIDPLSLFLKRTIRINFRNNDLVYFIILIILIIILGICAHIILFSLLNFFYKLNIRSI